MTVGFPGEEGGEGGVGEVVAGTLHSQHPGDPVEEQVAGLEKELNDENWRFRIFPSYPWSHIMCLWSTVVKVQNIYSEHRGGSHHNHTASEKDT